MDARITLTALQVEALSEVARTLHLQSKKSSKIPFRKLINLLPEYVQKCANDIVTIQELQQQHQGMQQTIALQRQEIMKLQETIRRLQVQLTTLVKQKTKIRQHTRQQRRQLQKAEANKVVVWQTVSPETPVKTLEGRRRNARIAIAEGRKAVLFDKTQWANSFSTAELQILLKYHQKGFLKEVIQQEYRNELKDSIDIDDILALKFQVMPLSYHC